MHDSSVHHGWLFIIQPWGDKFGEVTVRVEQQNAESIHQISVSVATLGMKEITQGALIRKLYTYSTENPTREAGNTRSQLFSDECRL